MEIKKKLDVIIWEIIIDKIVEIIVNVIFALAKRYPKSIFKKFIL